MKLTNQELLTVIKGRLALLESGSLEESDTNLAHLERIATAFEPGDPVMVRLLSYRDGSKIKVIKVLREHLGLGLANAKLLSEDLPTRRIDHSMKYGLDAFAKGLREVGAEVELVSP